MTKTYVIKRSILNAARKKQTARQSRRSVNRQAFTLIELLLVVGIIIILVAILIPSLTQAKRQAVNAMCLANLKQLSLTAHLYGSDNNGYLPRDNISGNIGNALWRSTLISEKGSGTAGIHYVTETGRTRGWGLAYVGGYNNQAKTFYCPFTTNTGTTGDFLNYWGPIGTSAADWRSDKQASGTQNRTRSGYNLNPYMMTKYNNPNHMDAALADSFPGLEEIPQSKQILAMDLMSTLHNHPDPVWNLATVDGAVNTYRNQYVWTSMHVTLTGDSGGWTGFDQNVGRLLGIYK